MCGVTSHCTNRLRRGGPEAEAQLAAGRMAALWRSYQRLMAQHPWKVQILTAGSLVGVGDVISQQLVERRGLSGHSSRRTLKMMAIGFCFVRPKLWSGSSLGAEKLARDMGAAGHSLLLPFREGWPPCFLGCFLAIAGALNGLSTEENWAKIRRITRRAAHQLLPLGQLCRCQLLLHPLNHRLAVVQVVAVVWNSYLSWKANQL
ncbi:mitochondrial inner membrane protein Mpv17 [Chelonoidis abingdonii]|uniref:mitochondrial inner membrane protein Mpv17 n=1 Tax=Chelonoidis abingdonii TaxID=106734 RepID=UPI003F49960C